MQEWEVIVAGSGPAGIAAAISCAQSGVKTLLLTEQTAEKLSQLSNLDTEPLQSLHPGAQSLLDQLQISGATAYASKGIYTGIQTGSAITPLSTVPGETWVGNHLSPALFNAYTIKMAQQRGVEVRLNCRMVDVVMTETNVSGVLLADGNTINCKYLIDATGRKRLAGKCLGFEDQVHSGPLISWTGVGLEKDDGCNKEIASFTPHQYGWTWIAYASSGYYTWTKLALNNNDFFASEIKLASPHPIKGANMQWRVFRPVVCPGLILVGDAAGVLDPAAGQGILNGLMTGIMGANTIIKCINEPLLANWYLTQYDSWLINLFNKKAENLKKKYAELGILID